MRANVLFSGFLLGVSASAFAITTPRETNVSDVCYPQEFTPAEIAYLDALYQANYPNAILIASASNTYNCHGYAWHKSEGGGAVWIGCSTSTAEDVYWTDGSYNSLSEGYCTKISYSGNHSAVKSTGGYYISKWGAAPLMKHYPDDCPDIYESPSNYYRRACDVPQEYSNVAAALNAAANTQTVKVNSSRTLDADGTVKSGGTLAIQSGVTITMNGKKIDASAGSITVAGGATVSPYVRRTTGGGTIVGLYPTINSATSAASSGQTVSVISGSLTQASDCTVPSGVTLSIGSGVTVTLNGKKIEAPSGTITVSGTISPYIRRTNSGGTIIGLYPTINSATSAASSGQKVVLAAATYNENASVSGGIELQGQGAGSTTLNGDVTFSYVSNATLKQMNVRGDIVVNGGSGNWVRDVYHRDWLEFNYGSGYRVYNCSHYQPSDASSRFSVHQCGLEADFYYTTSGTPDYGPNAGEADLDFYYSEVRSKNYGLITQYYATATAYNVTFCNNNPYDFNIHGGTTVYANGLFSAVPIPWTGDGTLNIGYQAACGGLMLGKPALAEVAIPGPNTPDAKAYDEVRAAYREVQNQITQAILNDEPVVGRFDTELRQIGEDFKQFIADFPESPYARSAARLLSFIYEQRGIPQGFNDYANAELKNAKNPDLISGLMIGSIHASVGGGDFKKGVETSDVLANLEVPLAQKESALYGKGIVYQYFLGDKQSAEEAYDSVLKLNPESGWADHIARHRKREALLVEAQPDARPQLQEEGQEELSLSNYPNPSNPSTAVSYSIPQSGQVRIQVFDVLGRLVSTLVDQEQEAGRYTVVWNGRDDRGVASVSGVYFCRMEFNGRALTRKMMLVR